MWENPISGLTLWEATAGRGGEQVAKDISKYGRDGGALKVILAIVYSKKGKKGTKTPAKTVEEKTEKTNPSGSPDPDDDDPNGNSISEIADAIANGHASDHLNDFGSFEDMDVESKDDLARLVDETIDHLTDSKEFGNNKKASYNEHNNVLVIEDPNHPDGGTVFQPTEGKEYYDGLKN
ncbi:MAG: hypothetical protein GXP03_02695 [Alphaproteobacteria bacterium]|nr:hypothetical protein [Alphaproteobacteria bacterium]